MARIIRAGTRAGKGQYTCTKYEDLTQSVTLDEYSECIMINPSCPAEIVHAQSIIKVLEVKQTYILIITLIT